ncbi:MAG: LamG domain-containing protein [Myxococcales bacterium]
MSRDGGADQSVDDIGSANGVDGIDDGAQVAGSGGASGSGGDTPNSGGVPFGGSAGGGTSTGGAPGGTGGASTGTGGQTSGGTGGAAGGADPDLVLWYKFDEGSGSNAADSAIGGGVARNATLMAVGTGTATFSTARQVGTHAVSLVGSSATAGGYVVLPSLQSLAPTATTIAAWVNLSANGSAQNWERVFDFGASDNVNMFLTARVGTAPNAVGFVITTGSFAGEQGLSATTLLSPNAWHHLAVVLEGGATYTGRLYIDGVQVATNPAMTLHPRDLGATTGNYIGRSHYATDPYFTGSVDDFRVYKRALTVAEITALFAFR